MLVLSMFQVLTFSILGETKETVDKEEEEQEQEEDEE